MDITKGSDILDSLLGEESMAELVEIDLDTTPDPLGLTTVAWSVIAHC